MPALVLLGLVGFGAQLINSSLGMGYGITSTTSLLALGATPALASATVNVSQVGSQLVSGLAHWRFGNVDWRVVRRIALPGAVGAFVGALFLTWLPMAVAAPGMALVLLVLGGYLLVRFTVWGTPRSQPGRPLRTRFLAPLGLAGGFLNSAGGSGWGPVGASALLATGRLAPRLVVGSVSAAEFVVVLAGSGGFLFGLGLAGIAWPWALAMLVGGALSAPIAAWLARRLPPRMIGSLVGGLIVVTNVRTLLHSDPVDAPPAVRVVSLTAVGVVCAVAVTWSARAHRREALAGVLSPMAGRPAESGAWTTGA